MSTRVMFYSVTRSTRGALVRIVFNGRTMARQLFTCSMAARRDSSLVAAAARQARIRNAVYVPHAGAVAASLLTESEQDAALAAVKRDAPAPLDAATGRALLERADAATDAFKRATAKARRLRKVAEDEPTPQNKRAATLARKRAEGLRGAAEGAAWLRSDVAAWHMENITAQGDRVGNTDKFKTVRSAPEWEANAPREVGSCVSVKDVRAVDRWVSSYDVHLTGERAS